MGIPRSRIPYRVIRFILLFDTESLRNPLGIRVSHHFLANMAAFRYESMWRL